MMLQHISENLSFSGALPNLSCLLAPVTLFIVHSLSRSCIKGKLAVPAGV